MKNNPCPLRHFEIFGRHKCNWKKWKMKRRRNGLKRMERPIGIEPTPEPWQGSRS